jgi:hypothetical protein
MLLLLTCATLNEATDVCRRYSLLTTDLASNALFVPTAAHRALFNGTSDRLECHDSATNSSFAQKAARTRGFNPSLPRSEYVAAARRVIDARCRATNTPYALSPQS